MEFQSKSKLCVFIANFIDENWKLHNRIINFVVMHSHMSREIGKMVDKCIEEWGIEKKKCPQLPWITLGNWLFEGKNFRKKGR